jgi:hypothetical protein
VRPTNREERVRRWYGWQILLSDGAAIASFVASSNGPGWTYFGLSLYAGGGPIIHAAHGSGEKVAGSLGLRLGIPLGGALLGAGIGAATGSGNPNCAFFCPSPSLIGAAVGVLVGMIVAPIIDISVLAFDDTPAQPHASAAPLRLQLAPVAALPRDSAGHVAPTMGLVGSF